MYFQGAKLKYYISVSLPRQDFVYGQKYKLSYKIINKSGKPLEISIKGINNKNINYNFKTSLKVVKSEIIQEDFYVGELEEAVDSLKTHPVVASEVFINGKRAIFKLGIVPRMPAEMEFKGNGILTYTSNVECYKGVNSKIYLDIENSFNEEVLFKFKLINNEDIQFLNETFEVEMKSKEKISLEINYKLKNCCFYPEDIKVIAVLKDGTNIEFEKKLTSVFRGRNGAFGGEEKNYYIIVNGGYLVKLSKVNNRIFFRAFEEDNVYEVARLCIDFQRYIIITM